MTRSLNAFGLIALVLLLGAGALFLFLREGPPTLYINEFMAHNTSCCPDTVSGGDEFDDWIEIYNGSKVPVNIAGMYFSQNKSNPIGHKIADTDAELTTIQPGGYLILWADASPGQGILHLDFKLDQDGEFLGFFDNHGRTIDSHVFTKQTPNISLGRFVDGGNEWILFMKPTPGMANR